MNMASPPSATGRTTRSTLTAGQPLRRRQGAYPAERRIFPPRKAASTIDRDWNRSGFFQIDNPAYTPTNGQPARLVSRGHRAPGEMTPGGLIYTGPAAIKGTYFGTLNPATGQASARPVRASARPTASGCWAATAQYGSGGPCQQQHADPR